MVHLDYRDARPIYEQIVRDIRRQIAAGILQQNDRLPSVRELAAELSINPNTIQRAYRELENQGCLVTIPGKGCFITGCRETASQLWLQFDSAATALLQQGIPLQSLLQHLIEGGNFHAPNV